MPDKTLKEIIKRILKVITPDKIILFGSRARGNARNDSDYDLLIVKDDIINSNKIEGEIYISFVGLEAPVDIILTTSEKLEKYKDTIGYVYKSALKDGIVVYG
jgi:predicted nucleotidyltransferase